MVINYKKKVNQFREANNYFLPNKEVLINLVKNKKYFSKFNCKPSSLSPHFLRA